MMRVTHGDKNRYTQSKLNRHLRREREDEYEHVPQRIRYDTTPIWTSPPIIPNQGKRIFPERKKDDVTKKRGGDAASDLAKIANEFTNPDSLLNQTDDKIRDAYRKAEEELGNVFDPNKNGVRQLFEEFRDKCKATFQATGDTLKYNLDPNLNGVNDAFRKAKGDIDKAFENIGDKMWKVFKEYLYPTPLLSLLGRGIKPLGDFFNNTLDKEWWEKTLKDPETYFFLAQCIITCAAAFLGPGGVALASGVVAAARIITKAAMDEPIMVTDILEMGLALMPQGRLIAGPAGRTAKTYGQFVMQEVAISLRGVQAMDPNARKRAMGQGLCACIATGQDIGLIPPVNKKGYIKTAIDNSNKDIERAFTGKLRGEYLKRYTVYVRNSVKTGTKTYKTDSGEEKTEDVIKQLNSFTTRQIELDDFKDADVIPRVLEDEQRALRMIEFWKENKLAQEDEDDYYANDRTKDIPVDSVSGVDPKTGESFYMDRPRIPDLSQPLKSGNIFLHVQNVPYKEGEFAAKTLDRNFLPPRSSETGWVNDPKARVFECMRDIPPELAKNVRLPLLPKEAKGETFESVYNNEPKTDKTGFWRECTQKYANEQPGATTTSDPRQNYIEQCDKYRKLYQIMLDSKYFNENLARDRTVIQDRLQKNLTVKTDTSNAALTWLTWIIEKEVQSYRRMRDLPYELTTNFRATWQGGQADTSYMLRYHMDFWTKYFIGPDYFKTPEEGKAFYAEYPDQYPEADFPLFDADTYGTDFHKQVELHMYRFFTVNLAPIKDTHASRIFTPEGARDMWGSLNQENDSLTCPFNETSEVAKDGDLRPGQYLMKDPAGPNGVRMGKDGKADYNSWGFKKVADAIEKELTGTYTSDYIEEDYDREAANRRFESSEEYYQTVLGMTRPEKLAHLRKLHATAGEIIKGLSETNPTKLLKDSSIWSSNNPGWSTRSIGTNTMSGSYIQMPSFTTDQLFAMNIREIRNLPDGNPDRNRVRDANEEFGTINMPTARSTPSLAVSFPWPVAIPKKIVEGKNDPATLERLKKEKADWYSIYEQPYNGGDYYARVKAYKLFRDYMKKQPGSEKDNSVYSMMMRRDHNGQIDEYYHTLADYESAIRECVWQMGKIDKFINDMFPELYPLREDWLAGNVTLQQLATVWKGVQEGNPLTGVIPELSEQYFIKYYMNENTNKATENKQYKRPYEFQVRLDNATPAQRIQLLRQESNEGEFSFNIAANSYDNMLFEMRARSIGGPPDFRPVPPKKERTIQSWDSYKTIKDENRPYSRTDIEQKAREAIRNACVILAGQNPDFFKVYSINGMKPVIDYYMGLMKVKDSQDGTTVNFDTAKAKQDQYLNSVQTNYEQQLKLREATTAIKDPFKYEYNARLKKATPEQFQLYEKKRSELLIQRNENSNIYMPLVLEMRIQSVGGPPNYRPAKEHDDTMLELKAKNKVKNQFFGSRLITDVNEFEFEYIVDKLREANPETAAMYDRSKNNMLESGVFSRAYVFDGLANTIRQQYRGFDFGSGTNYTALMEEHNREYQKRTDLDERRRKDKQDYEQFLEDNEFEFEDLGQISIPTLERDIDASRGYRGENLKQFEFNERWKKMSNKEKEHFNGIVFDNNTIDGKLEVMNFYKYGGNPPIDDRPLRPPAPKPETDIPDPRGYFGENFEKFEFEELWKRLTPDDRNFIEQDYNRMGLTINDVAYSQRIARLKNPFSQPVIDNRPPRPILEDLPPAGKPPEYYGYKGDDLLEFEYNRRIDKSGVTLNFRPAFNIDKLQLLREENIGGPPDYRPVDNRPPRPASGAGITKRRKLDKF